MMCAYKLFTAALEQAVGDSSQFLKRRKLEDGIL